MPQQLLSALETQYGLPSGLLNGAWHVESGAGRYMDSPVGAQGHFQFMPDTAKQYGVTNPYDFNQSARGAAHMFSDLSKQFNGDVPSMLAAYNWGQGNVTRKGLTNAPAETRAYIAKIMPYLSTPMPSVTAPATTAMARPASAMARPASAMAATHTAQPQSFGQQAWGMLRDAVAPAAYADEVPQHAAASTSTDPELANLFNAYDASTKSAPAPQTNAMPQTNAATDPELDNLLQAYQASQSSSATPPPTAQPPAAPDYGMLYNAEMGLRNGLLNLTKGAGRALMDPLQGAAYLGAAGVDKIFGTHAATAVSNYNQRVEDTYQNSTPGSYVAGTGRFLGSILNPINEALLPTRVASLMPAAAKAMPILNKLLPTAADLAPTAAKSIGSQVLRSTVNGAASGALATKTDNDNILLNMLIGGGLGASGQAVASYLPKALNPSAWLQSRIADLQAKMSPAEKQNAINALNLGFELNTGTMTGSKPLQTFESMLDYLPFTANRGAQMAQHNANVANRLIGDTIGLAPDATSGLTSEAVEAQRKILEKSFGNVKDQMALSPAAGEGLFNDVAKLAQRSATDPQYRLTGENVGAVNNMVNNVLSSFDNDFSMNGHLYHQALDHIENAMGSNPSINYYGQALKNTLNSAFRGEAPDALKAFQGLRQNIKDAHIIDKTLKKVTDGNVPFKPLVREIANNYDSTSNVPIMQLAKVIASTVGNKIPDSGTAQRTFYQNAITKTWPSLAMSGLPMAGAAGTAKLVGASLLNTIAPLVIGGTTGVGLQKYLAPIVNNAARRGLLSPPVAAPIAEGTHKFANILLGGGMPARIKNALLP